MKLKVPRKNDAIIAVALYLLNIFDMVATMYAVRSGYGMEMNPLMRFLMNHGMGYFVFVKVVVMAFFMFFMLQVPLGRRLNNGLVFLAGMYTMLGIGHVLIYLNR